MAEARGGKEPTGPVKGRFELADADSRHPLELHIELVDPAGKRTPLSIEKNGEFQLDAKQLRKGLTVEVGAAQAGGEKRVFSYDSLYQQLRNDPVYRLSKPVWSGWLLPQTCVTGDVSRCGLPPWVTQLEESASLLQLRARLTGVDAVYRGAIDSIFPLPCRPVCQGKVEVFLRTCCCPPIPPPWVVIKNICEIIDCTQIEWPPHWPPPGDPLGPRPGPGPDPAPIVERIAFQAIQNAAGRPNAPDPEQILGLTEHLVALRSLSPGDQAAYIDRQPDLIALCCQCTTSKVAEVPIQADGHFDACFYAGPLRFNCSRRVLYRAWQMQNGAWTLIYDGLASNQSFAPSDDAQLRASWRAQTCGDPPPPVVGGAKPFVLLEAIGGTWASEVNHSTNETGETTWGALAAQDGTVFSNERPWASTLNVRYHFSDGLEGLGAKYYRTRIVPLNGGGSPQTIKDGVSWLRYHVTPALEIEIVSESLGPVDPSTVGGETGLYRIPYHRVTEDWLGGQFHANVATADGSMPNGQYLFVVDIFDAAGKRLIPAGAPAAGANEIGNVGFEYRRMEHVSVTPIPTDVVSQKALPNLFLVNNTPCQGLITGLTQGVFHNQDCLSLSSTDGDAFAIRYYAFQAQHYMESRTLTIKKGLFGSINSVETSATEIPGPPGSDSTTLSITGLLGADKHCSFTATLTVEPKHWNGWSTVSAYRVIDPVAFALSQP
jgi:hypothetical protein